MSNLTKQNGQYSLDNSQKDQADKIIDITESNLLKQQQELKELEDSLTQKEKIIAQKEHELKVAKDSIAKKEAELNEKCFSLEEKELQAINGFPQLFEEKFATFKNQLVQREAQCVNELKIIEGEKEKLRQRELAVQKAEIQRDNGYADERAKLDAVLLRLQKEQEKELGSKRAEALTAIEKEISKERVARIENLEKEIIVSLTAHETKIQQEKNELEQKRNILIDNQANLDELKDVLKYQEKRLQSRKESLDEREANLDLEVDAKVIERKQSFDNDKSRLDDEIARLRESIKTSSDLISNFEELKHKLGDKDPADVLLKLKTYEEEIKKLRDDLAKRPTQEMQEAFDRLKSEKEHIEREKEKYKEDYQKLLSFQKDQNELEAENDSLRRKNKTLTDQRDNIEAHNNQLQSDIKRLQSAYEREADREARVRDIEQPYIQKQLPRAQEEISEIQWLERISKSCTDYGLRFPRRILYAFHTALKTAEWSPMTVLSGVSGTGKSELPRLYSHFGGINFLPLSVQPNWDSQESMLGFFNSIDNKFDAQPVLRLLAQSQKTLVEDYPGLEDVMSLILLDEMNLAHVELYFAEFLSKLELRRGRKGNEVPCLEVKLGAGIEHYDLPLGRNVLWAGTMNQDETTKSLSDKVLDRGIVINFPRPTTLERRHQLKPLGNSAPLLSRKLWESWWCKETSFTNDQILPFKSFIEEMNNSLSKVGRALGHRVWQSIEYYMANYPDVLEAQKNNDDAGLVKAMKIAFEDQLVQKVMPKLRGIETRKGSKSRTDCLDKIRVQLISDDYSIVEDFDWACSDINYGQFIWSSANYIKDDEILDGQYINISKEVSSIAPGKIKFKSSSVTEKSYIPDAIIEYVSDNSKELWQITINEIMKVMLCDVKIAKSIKDLCNETKES